MKNKRLKNFSMFLYMLRHFPTFVLGELLEALLSDLVTYISTVVFLKYIISAMVTKKAVNEMLIWLAVFALFQIGADLYRSFYGNIARPKLYEKIRRWFYYDLKNGIGNYELYVYDNPDFYDDMTYVSTHLVDDATASVSYISEIVSAQHCFNLKTVFPNWNCGFVHRMLVNPIIHRIGYSHHPFEQ